MKCPDRSSTKPEPVAPSFLPWYCASTWIVLGSSRCATEATERLPAGSGACETVPESPSPPLTRPSVELACEVLVRRSAEHAADHADHQRQHRHHRPQPAGDAPARGARRRGGRPGRAGCRAAGTPDASGPSGPPTDSVRAGHRGCDRSRRRTRRRPLVRRRLLAWGQPAVTAGAGQRRGVLAARGRWDARRSRVLALHRVPTRHRAGAEGPSRPYGASVRPGP